MPSLNSEIPSYLSHVDNIFEQNEIDSDLRISLLQPFLTSKARQAMLHQPAAVLEDYTAWKLALLKEHRLTPNLYRQNYLNATKSQEDSYVQFTTKLRCLLSFYLESRKVSTFDDLKDLLVSDRLKDSLTPAQRMNISNREDEDTRLPADRIASLTDSHVAVHMNQTPYRSNYQGSKWSNTTNNESTDQTAASSASAPTAGKGFTEQFNKSTPAAATPAKQKQVSPTQGDDVRCDHCHWLGHSKEQCTKNPDSVKNNLCFICRSSKHHSKECPKKKQTFKVTVVEKGAKETTPKQFDVKKVTCVLPSSEVLSGSTVNSSNSHFRDGVSLDLGCDNNCKATVDTGASISVIPPQLLPSHLLEE